MLSSWSQETLLTSGLDLSCTSFPLLPFFCCYVDPKLEYIRCQKVKNRTLQAQQICCVSQCSRNRFLFHVSPVDCLCAVYWNTFRYTNWTPDVGTVRLKRIHSWKWFSLLPSEQSTRAPSSWAYFCLLLLSFKAFIEECPAQQPSHQNTNNPRCSVTALPTESRAKFTETGPEQKHTATC